MKGVVFVLCAVTGGVAGGLIAPMLKSDPPESRARPARQLADNARQTERIEDLERRILVLERLDRTPPAPREKPTPVRPDGGATNLPSEGRGGEADTRRKPVTIPKDVLEAVQKLIGQEMTHDASNALFGWLSRDKDKIVAAVAALQEAVRLRPSDAELQVAYATALVAQLTNLTTQGPQQSILWQKASNAYDAALKVKPEHWQARFGKAFGISMAPEFLGLKPVAIKQFEELREIQSRQAPAKHHVQTYLRLGTLYKDMGNADKAREVWDNGLRLFPDSAVLKGALEASTKR